MHNQLKEPQDVFLRSAFVVSDYQRGCAWARRFASFPSEDAAERAKNVPETFVVHCDAHS